MTEIPDDASTAERAILERTDLALANILGVKDRIRGISPEDSGRLRSVVLREVNELTTLAVGLLRATADGGVANELFIDMIREIHNTVVVNSPSTSGR